MISVHQIGFMGRPRAGKDYCLNKLYQNKEVTMVRFADPIKEVSKLIFDKYGNDHDIKDVKFDISTHELLGFDQNNKQFLVIDKILNILREYYFVKDKTTNIQLNLTIKNKFYANIPIYFTESSVEFESPMIKPTELSSINKDKFISAFIFTFIE